MEKRNDNTCLTRGRGSSINTWLAIFLILILATAIVLGAFFLNKNRGGSGGETGVSGTYNPSETPGGKAPASLIVNEIMRGDDGFVEVVNNSSKTVNLGDYHLTDNPSKHDKWIFPEYDLEPGSYAVVKLRGSAFAGNSFEGVSTASDGSTYPVFNATFKLNSEENGLYCYTRSGNIVSSMVFDPEMPEPVCAVRVGSGTAFSGIPTPGSKNADKYFTDLNWRDADVANGVYISEVLPKNKYDIIDEDGDRSDWVEIHNSSGESVSLLGYWLSDNSLDPAKWAFPDITLASGEYLIVFLSGKDRSEGGELHTSFKLSPTDDGIFLSNYSDFTRDTLAVPSDINDNVSIGRGDDGTVLYFAKPTPGAKNTTVGFTTHIGVGGFNPSSVYISEVCAVTAPRSGEFDWVELYNASSSSVSLTGWHLSDSVNDLTKHDLSSVTIPAGGYATINCSSSIKKAWATPAPFNISPAGETLYLTNEEGAVCDCFESGAQRLGVTSGRATASTDGARVFFATATKGEQNAPERGSRYASAPVFSDTSLYHDSAFSVEIDTSTVSGVIHYTLDGSKPTAESAVYASPIPINANTVLRAIVIADGMVDSDITTATYLFETKHTLPVVTLAIDKGDFSEVYAVNKAFVPVVERECHMQFYEKDGALGVESPAGVRVSGASTRAYAQKSLGLYFRGGYGRSSISYPFFGSSYATTFGSLVLRNAGQDWSNARIRDSFASTAVLDLNIDASASRFCAVYINGEYWGLYDLKENMNEDYLKTHYSVDPDTANIIKRNTLELEGSNSDFLRVRGYCVKNDTVIPMTDARFSEFEKWVDTDSIMDYLIARQYFPDADMFNQKYWRTTDYTVRWRAVFFDSDYALASSIGDVLHCYFDPKGVPSANGSLSQMDLYCGLASNEKWKHDFLVRYIYVTKYYLNNDRLLPLLDSMAAEIEPEMERQIARWGHPVSMSHWKSEIAKLRQNLVERPQYSKQNLMFVMKLSQSAYDALEAEADAIHEANGGVFK